MGASLYEPINVYKCQGPDMGIVDGPFEYLTIAGVKLPLPFTTRMTVVRLPCQRKAAGLLSLISQGGRGRDQEL